jgi:hypothetical protein
VRAAIVLLAAACTNPQPRPLPQADWARGATASLRWVGEESTMNPGRTGYLVEVRDAIAKDLRAAGMTVAPDGELRIDLMMSQDYYPTWTVRAGKHGFVVKTSELACARWSIEPGCIGREIAARILSAGP